MKKLLLKSILLLCALITGTSSSWADSHTIGWGDASGAAGTYTNFTAVSGSVKDVVSFYSDKNSSGSNPAYNSTNKELRLYFASNGDGGSITLTPAVGVTITGFVMTTSTTPSVNYSVDGSAFTSVTASSSTYTVTSISATSSLEIKNANTTNTQLRIKTIQITYNVAAVTKHTATFNVNGDETSEDFAEGEDVVFPSDPSNIGGKKFVGWASSAIVGTTDDEPTFVTSAKMGTSNITYYAVFASQADVISNTSLTIAPSTTNIPTSYADATDYTLEGKKFTIHQMYKNGEKLQFKASVGYIYNKTAMYNIQSIVITYNSSDANKNFTLHIGDANNPTDGTEITPAVNGSEYTFDCSTYDKKYFVLKNGEYAGYLDKIKINYQGFVSTYSSYCTTVPVSANIAVTIAASGFSTIASGYGLDFSNATPAGLEAYVVSSVSTSAVTLASIDEAPASTGVILKGAAGTEYSIPVKSAATFDGTNKLKAAVNPTGVDDNTVYIMKGGKFCKVSNMSIIPAGKAYLLADDIPASARELNLVFDDETTGIVRIENADLLIDNGQYFDLQGRKVTQPTKGLYFVNGKKIIIK